MMEVGEIYYWETDVPRFMRDARFRYHKVLSVTLTHVYARNIKTGLQMNHDIKNFKENFSLCERNENI